MMPYLITGLPRSRTAWLANALTTDKSLCFHDVRFDEGLLRLDRRIGFAGPELVTQFEEIRAAYPMAPWLVIHRNPEDALTSFRNFAGPRLKADFPTNQFWRNRVQELEGIMYRSRVLLVDYNWGLDHEETAREVWQHLLPGLAFDPLRWSLLQGFNVQQQFQPKETR